MQMKHNTPDHRLLIRTLFSTLVATDIDSVGPDAEVMILRQAIFCMYSGLCPEFTCSF